MTAMTAAPVPGRPHDELPPRVDWLTRPFDRLTLPLLHGMLRLRSAVFVVEQHCVYQDIDDADLRAWFVIGCAADAAPGIGSDTGLVTGPDTGVAAVLATARVLPPGSRYAEPSIGRVCTAADVRGSGQGRQLMRQAIALADALYPGQSIRISAQAHLDRFYGSLGFRVDSAPYDKDGIPHVEMVRAATGGATG